MNLSEKRIEFDVNDAHIVGELWGENVEQKSDFVFLHGAGKSTRKRARQFLNDETMKVVPNVLAIDQSGHGESSGELKKTSLEQRTAEALEAIKLYSNQRELTVFGSSMGGYVALELLKEIEIKNLLLFAPAVYGKDAFTLRFDSGFTEAIRKPESWKENSVMAELKKFRGNLLLVIGEMDAVIPKGVVEMIDQSAVSAKSKEVIVIPECPHPIHDWFETNHEVRDAINEKIIQLLK